MSWLEEMVRDYGYWAILVGTLLEGETILVLGGLAVFHNNLEMDGVILSAFVGSLLGDQLWFYVGRRGGRALLARKPQWKPAMERIDRIMMRHQYWFILIFRFLYGLRTVAPFAIGMSNVRILTYTFLNVVGAAIWAVSVAWLGYYLGNVLTSPAVRSYERIAIGLLIGGFVMLWYWRWRRGQRAARAAAQAQAQVQVPTIPTPPPPPILPAPALSSETIDA